jgi:uncharacterized Zn finger protein
MRESAEAKGRRYVVEGRLLIHSVTTTTITATVRGNGEIYDVGYSSGAWYCTCPAASSCAHKVALQLVVVAPPIRRLARAGAA